MKTIFICRGNVARSVMAEEFYKKFIDTNTASYGTMPSDEGATIESARPKTDDIIAVMQEEGIDISKKTRDKITKEIANSADRIVMLLDDDDPRPDYLTDNPNAELWKVKDPKGTDINEHRRVRDEIKKLILENLKDGQ